MKSGKREQRIKLQLDGNPIKLDATIMSMSEDGKRMKVRFDGPLDDTELFVWNPHTLIDRELKAEEIPAQFSDIRVFKVVG